MDYLRETRGVGGRIAYHKAEMRAVATIKQMYTEGVSKSAIARFLATMKIPIKQQGKGWHNNTFVKILKEEGLYTLMASKHRGSEGMHCRSCVQ